MAEPAKLKTPTKILKRAQESVIRAVVGGELPVEAVGSQRTLIVGQSGGPPGQPVVEAMYLHPAGLVIHRGNKRIVMPVHKLNYIEFAEDAE